MTAKLGISFPAELVKEIDKMSKGLKKSRSEVVRDAMTRMINDYKRQQAVEKAERIYKEIAAEDKRLAEDFLSICSESLTAYKTVRRTKKK